MHTTQLRKVGGSVMLAVPPVLLEMLDLSIGERVALTVKDGQMVIQPQKMKPHYPLDDLLAQCDAEAPFSEEERLWLDSPAVGRELV